MDKSKLRAPRRENDPDKRFIQSIKNSAAIRGVPVEDLLAQAESPRQEFIRLHLEWRNEVAHGEDDPETLGRDWDTMRPAWKDGALDNIRTNLTIARVARGSANG